MNKLQRAPWVALTESGYILCCHCRYGGCADWGCELECTHPLEVVNDPPNGLNMEPGDDCWGFRPTKGDTVETGAARLQEWQAEDAAREGDL